MKLSINNGFAMKRWPEPEVWSALIAERLGLDDVQFSLDLVSLEQGHAALEREAGEIARCCAQAGVVVSSVFSGLGHYCCNLMAHPDEARRREAFEQYRRAIDFTAALGADTFGGHMGAMSVRDHEDQGRRAHLRDEMLERVAALADHAVEAGLAHLLWEPMPLAREWPSTLDECHDLATTLASMPGARVGYCLDVGHCCRPDLGPDERDPYRWVRELASVSPIVHLQQTDGLGDRHWPFTTEHNARGIIHPDRLLEALGRADKSTVTHLTFEVFPAFEQEDDAVLADMKASCDYWRGYRKLVS